MSARRRTIIGTGLALALTLGAAPGPVGTATAQLDGGAPGSYALEDGERNLKFAGIPVPGYNDVLGFNLGLVGMAYYKLNREDDACPPSSSGLFGFYSANKSWLGAVFQKIHYDEDNWRAMFAFGTGSIEYQFNPAAIGPGLPDVFLDYSTATNFLFLEGSRRAWRKLYLGLDLVSWSAKVGLEPDVIETEDQRYTGPGLNAEWDDRNHVFTPTAGWNLTGRWLVYDGALGSDRDFSKLNLTLTGFQQLGDSTRVLAGRLLTESGFGDVPFSAQSIVSGQRNLRGYANGRYRADQLLVIETEYRWNFWRRWGAVAFAGLAFSEDNLRDMSLNEVLPGSGLGLRFAMIEKYRINVRIDYGWGKHDQAVYFGVGEAY